MRLHLIQIVSKLALVLLFFDILNAKDIPVMKQTTIEIPAHDYSIITFPFKITEIQMGGFTYKKQKKEPIPLVIKENKVKKITLSKTNKQSALIPKHNQHNLLNIKKIDNMLTFRPKTKGEIEIVLWGNKDFPMLIKIKVVDVADKNINFIQPIDSRKEVITFENSPHEKVIEKIMKHLHNSKVNPKPRGYENIVRKEIYDVGIENRDGKAFAKVRVRLNKEIIGKLYVGQVWNVNIIKKFDIPKDFTLTLYEEMFDSPGVFAVSLETYSITKEHGTRVMVVRRKDRK